MNAKDSIYQKFIDGTFAGKTITEICKLSNIPYREKNRMLSVLDALCEERKIFQNDGGRYGTSEQLGLITGKISGNERGFAFLVPDDQERFPQDFFIPHKNLRGALHGDTVLAEQVYERSDDEARVVSVLSRGYTTIVGTFRKDRRGHHQLSQQPLGRGHQPRGYEKADRYFKGCRKEIRQGPLHHRRRALQRAGLR